VVLDDVDALDEDDRRVEGEEPTVDLRSVDRRECRLC
jgi:hypothetical protein